MVSWILGVCRRTPNNFIGSVDCSLKIEKVGSGTDSGALDHTKIGPMGDTTALASGSAKLRLRLLPVSKCF